MRFEQLRGMLCGIKFYSLRELAFFGRLPDSRFVDLIRRQISLTEFINIYRLPLIGFRTTTRLFGHRLGLRLA